MTDSRDDYLGLVVAGWMMAFLLPPGGLAAGFVLVNRRPEHAAGILVVSVMTLALIAWGVTTLLL